MNLLPDYFSLLESRYVIRWMGTHPLWKARLLALLTLDVIFTAAIFFAGLFLFGGYMYLVLTRLLTVWTFDFWELFITTISELFEHWLFLSSPRDSLSFGVFFYSTFFTSVWVWLYALSGLVVKLAGYLGIGFNRLKWFLDIENKPLHSLGVISMLLVTLIYLVGAGFYSLVGSS